MATPATRRRVRFPYPFDKPAKPVLNQAKPVRRSRPARPPDETLWGSWSLNSTAHRAGLRVSETKHEMTVDAAIVTANCRKKSPDIPERKADGTKTAHNVSAIEISAPPTSSIVLWAASDADMPERMLRSTFSTTTIASSTTMPTARTKPNSERLFSDIPSAYRTANVPTRETGIAITGIIEALKFWRNKNTTPSTRRMAMKIVMTTSRTDLAMKVVGS